MFIVHVFIDIKPEFLDDFILATIANAKASIQEPGIARFDFMQDLDDPSQFLLVEVYRTREDPARHKETVHYKQWRDKVEDMVATPRTKKIYTNIFPDEKGWD